MPVQANGASCPDAPDDTILARRAALGDREAFGQIVDRHGQGMHRYALRMLPCPTDAEDCVQEALLAAWTALPTFEGRSTLKTWLFAIQANKVRQLLRRDAPPAVTTEDVVQLESTSASPEQAALRDALQTALEAALADLPSLQRACWMLRAVEGLSYAEIALVQGTSLTVVRGQLHRARAELNRRLEAWR